VSSPSLPTLARRALHEAKAEGTRLLLAVSGGSDSTALLHVMAHIASAAKLDLHAHGVDHGLRLEAAAELEAAGALARSLAIPWTTTSLAVAPGANLQARARRARHAALEAARAACEARFVVTAHHAADRAETVLVRLLRGAPAAGLGVLPVVEGTRLRPLVRAPKELILAYLERHQLEHARDPSNEDPRFLRVRIRTELMPLLRSLAPAIETTLCTLADAHAPAPASDDPHENADLALLRSLPRASLAALRKLAVDRAQATRVWLPGGLAARWDGPHDEMTIEDIAGQAPAEKRENPVRSRGPLKSRSIQPRRSS